MKLKCHQKPDRMKITAASENYDVTTYLAAFTSKTLTSALNTFVTLGKPTSKLTTDLTQTLQMRILGTAEK